MAMTTRLTTMHVAAGLGDTGTVRALLAEGADPNALTAECGASPLHLAAQVGSVPVGEALLAAGAFLNLQAPTTGVTALMTAVWFRKVAMVRFLLEQPRINVELHSVFGVTAAGLVGFGSRDNDAHAVRQNAEMQRLFADYVRYRDALLYQQPLFTILTNAELSDGERATEVRRVIAAFAADPQVVNTVSPVLSSGSDGHTPLLVAARDGNVDAVAELLAAGADQTLADEYMRSVAAHKAAYRGHAEVLALLVQAPGFDRVINAQGPFNGYTPLHDAVWHGDASCVRILVEAGARMDLTGHDGKTPADLAREYGYDDCLALLETGGMSL
jgi:ankyrin repeat protein